jgi:hypothetical protein
MATTTRKPVTAVARALAQPAASPSFPRLALSKLEAADALGVASRLPSRRTARRAHALPEAPIERAVGVVAGKRKVGPQRQGDVAGDNDLAVRLDGDGLRECTAARAEIRQYLAAATEAPVECSSEV